MTAFDTLKAKYPVGSKLDVDGYPPSQPYQCFDVPEEYIRLLSGNPSAYFSAPSGYAKDFYNEYPNSALLQSLFDRYYGFSTTGQAGDIAVWGNSPQTPDSHVAILEVDNGTSQHIYGQNQPYPYITERDLTSTGLLGYLRPKNQGGTNVAIIQNADNWKFRANKSFVSIRGREMGDAEFTPWVGQDFLHLVEALEDNTEADANVAAANLGRQAQSQNWQQEMTDLQAQLNNEISKENADQATITDLQKQISDLTDKLNATSTPVTPVSPPASTFEPHLPVDAQHWYDGFLSFVKAVLGIKS